MLVNNIKDIEAFSRRYSRSIWVDIAKRKFTLTSLFFVAVYGLFFVVLYLDRVWVTDYQLDLRQFVYSGLLSSEEFKATSVTLRNQLQEDVYGLQTQSCRFSVSTARNLDNGSTSDGVLNLTIVSTVQGGQVGCREKLFAGVSNVRQNEKPESSSFVAAKIKTIEDELASINQFLEESNKKILEASSVYDLSQGVSSTIEQLPESTQYESFEAVETLKAMRETVEEKLKLQIYSHSQKYKLEQKQAELEHAQRLLARLEHIHSINSPDVIHQKLLVKTLNDQYQSLRIQQENYPPDSVIDSDETVVQLRAQLDSIDGKLEREQKKRWSARALAAKQNEKTFSNNQVLEHERQYNAYKSQKKLLEQRLSTLRGHVPVKPLDMGTQLASTLETSGVQSIAAVRPSVQKALLGPILGLSIVAAYALFVMFYPKKRACSRRDLSLAYKGVIVANVPPIERLLEHSRRRTILAIYILIAISGSLLYFLLFLAFGDDIAVKVGGDPLVDFLTLR